MEVSSTENREAILKLEAIRQDLQDSLPNKCVFTSEKIVMPKVSITPLYLRFLCNALTMMPMVILSIYSIV